jgi:hypothetical protein
MKPRIEKDVSHLVVRSPKVLRSLCALPWTDDDQLRACCKQMDIECPKSGTLTIAERRRAIKTLERRGYHIADLTDPEHISLCKDNKGKTRVDGLKI